MGLAATGVGLAIVAIAGLLALWALTRIAGIVRAISGLYRHAIAPGDLATVDEGTVVSLEATATHGPDGPVVSPAAGQDCLAYRIVPRATPAQKAFSTGNRRTLAIRICGGRFRLALPTGGVPDPVVDPGERSGPGEEYIYDRVGPDDHLRCSRYYTVFDGDGLDQYTLGDRLTSAGDSPADPERLRAWLDDMYDHSPDYDTVEEACLPADTTVTVVGIVRRDGDRVTIANEQLMPFLVIEGERPSIPTIIGKWTLPILAFAIFAAFASFGVWFGLQFLI